MTDRSPPQRWHSAGGLLPFDFEIGHVIRQIRSAFHCRLVNSVFEDEGLEWRSGDEGLTDDPVLPRDRLSIGSERGTDRVIGAGTIVAASDVVLARPDDFHRRLDRLRDLNRLLHEVRIGHRTAAETAA